MSHQDRGMKTAVVLLRGCVQDLAIQVGIIRMEEAGGAVVAALDDRLGEVRGIDSGEASPCILSNVGGYLWTRREHKSAKFTLTPFLPKFTLTPFLPDPVSPVVSQETGLGGSRSE